MPWQECNQMDERVKFIAGLLDGEKMAVLCRRFGISRKTGYKILNRYNSCGLEGLTDRSRRPYRHANQLPIQIETLIVQSKQERPHWGAPKIRERLARSTRDLLNLLGAIAEKGAGFQITERYVGRHHNSARSIDADRIGRVG